LIQDLIRHFIVFEADKDKDGSVKISKKIAQYQQYNARQLVAKLFRLTFSCFINLYSIE